jgi:hypothetical protein
VCAVAGVERVTLGDWKRHLGGGWGVDDFRTNFNQDGPNPSKADISKWISSKHPKRETATVPDQRQVTIDRTKYINTPAIKKALDNPTPAEMKNYKATTGMKTMDEGVFIQKFANSVSKWVSTLASSNLRQQWPDPTLTHRP